MERAQVIGITLFSAIIICGCGESSPTGSSGWEQDLTPAFAVASGSGFAATPISPDANTVILDHFDGGTTGTPVGPLAFGMSLDGLGQAGVFSLGNYVRYAFSGWGFTGPGTVEMWILPSTLHATRIANVLNVNWGNTGSYPPAGHILHLSISKPGDEAAGSFWPAGGATGTTSLPVGLWTHLALSWGPAGTKIYVDGALEAVGTPGGPGMIGTNYAYLNYWGTFTDGWGAPVDGLIDEFHLSNVQRSDAEIAQHAALVQTVLEIVIDIKPGSDPNSINCRNDREATAVAILTMDDFDATTVDHSSVTFGPSGATETHVDPRTGEPRRHEEDVDGDGDMDLVFHFRTGYTGIQCGDTEATLTGETFDGTPIEGTDAINTVP